MKSPRKTTLILLAVAALSSLGTGCASTRSENGVTIEQSRSYNPMNYLPW
jgi:hypothetical protein